MPPKGEKTAKTTDTPTGAEPKAKGGQARTPPDAMIAVDFATGLPVNPTPGETGETPGPEHESTPELQVTTELQGGVVFSEEQQAALDRIIRERVERERRRFGDYDDLKAKAQQLDEIEQAKKSELEKLQERLAEMQSQMEMQTLEAREATLRSAVVAAASKLGFADPDDAWHMVDVAGIQYGETGEPSNVEALLTEMAKVKPYLLARTRPVSKPVAPTGQGGPPTRTDADRRIEYFGGLDGRFWEGGGVRMAPEERNKPPQTTD